MQERLQKEHAQDPQFIEETEQVLANSIFSMGETMPRLVTTDIDTGRIFLDFRKSEQEGITFIFPDRSTFIKHKQAERIVKWDSLEISEEPDYVEVIRKVNNQPIHDTTQHISPDEAQALTNALEFKDENNE